MIALERLAREAGFYFAKDDFPDCAEDEMEARMPAVQRFAQLVAEEAARIAEQLCNEHGGVAEGPIATEFGKMVHQSVAAGAMNCAAAIREAFGIKEQG